MQPYTPLSMLSILFTHRPGFFHPPWPASSTINAGVKLVDIQPGPARETRDDHCRRFGYQKLPAVSLAFDPMTTYT